MVTELYLLRHGSLNVVPGTLVGSTDLPLSDGNETEGYFVRSAGQLVDVELWFCSPMLRCRQTLDLLRQQTGPVGTVRYDDRLREIDFGRWEMRDFAAINAEYPEYVESWSRYMDFVFPGGEAVVDFCDRVEDMLELFMAHDAEKIGVITHGGVIRTMICLALGLSVRHYLLFDVQPASLTVLQLFSQGGVLKGLNV